MSKIRAFSLNIKDFIGLFVFHVFVCNEGFLKIVKGLFFLFFNVLGGPIVFDLLSAELVRLYSGYPPPRPDWRGTKKI